MFGRKEARGEQKKQVQGKKKAGISPLGKVGGKQGLGEAPEREPAVQRREVMSWSNRRGARCWGLGQVEVLLAAGPVNLVPGTSRGSAERERKISGIGVRGFGWSPSSAENFSLARSLEILKPRFPLVQDW